MTEFGRSVGGRFRSRPSLALSDHQDIFDALASVGLKLMPEMEGTSSQGS